MSLPSLIVEVAFTTNPDAPVPEWADVSDRVKSMTVRRGRQHELDTVQAGVCTVRLDNGDRALDPTYTYSPYYPYVLPMKKLRVSAVWNSTTYYLFTGYVERWPITWEAPQWGSVTVTAVDGMALLAQADLAGDFPEELSGARIERVLSAAFWPESAPLAGYWTLGTSILGTSTILSFGVPQTVVDDGQTTIPAVTFEEGSSESALSHIQNVAMAERGLFFIDGEGRAIFQDRHSRYGAASTVTFTDDLATLSASRLKYQGLQPDFDVERIANEVIVTASGGTTPQTATDSESRTLYGRRTLALSLLLTTDAEASARAAFELSLSKDPSLEFVDLTVLSPAQDAAWPHTLGLDLSDLVTVERTPDSVDAITVEEINRDVFVESVAHTANGAQWSTSFQLSPADEFGSFFILDVAELDSEATAVLAY